MIPLVFHFIFGLHRDFGGKPFSFMHYMAIKSAMAVHPEAKAFLYFTYEPEGIYWEIAQRYVEKVKVQPPTEIHGKPLLHVAHQADVLRLQILLESGGIYLDMDTITTRGFESLLNNSCVMALQGEPPNYRGLCNAVILSKPQHPFLIDWLASYSNFRSKGRDQFWDEQAVIVPKQLADSGKYDITILEPAAFFVPTHDHAGIADLFIEDKTFPESYCHHLWETFSWIAASRINERNVSLLQNTYCRIAKKHVATDLARFEKLRDAAIRDLVAKGIRLNLGCGVKRLVGWLNVDRESEVGPDMQFDLEEAPWPLADDSVVEVNLSHVLEHVGPGIRSVLTELYRVSRNGALIHVRVPAPTHDWFWTDPTHIRAFLPDSLRMLDRELCKIWVVTGDSKTPLALYWDVDFVMERSIARIDSQVNAERIREKITDQELRNRARHQNNIIAEYEMDLRVRKIKFRETGH